MRLADYPKNRIVNAVFLCLFVVSIYDFFDRFYTYLVLMIARAKLSKC
jgi:hypothetical protein